MGADVDYWTRGTVYHDVLLRNADAVVVILPENKWTKDLPSLPNGTRSEIELAMSLKKGIYLAYRSTYGGGHNFYETAVSKAGIGGMSGSSDTLAKKIANHNKKDEPKASKASPPPYAETARELVALEVGYYSGHYNKDHYIKALCKMHSDGKISQEKYAEVMNKLLQGSSHTPIDSNIDVYPGVQQLLRDRDEDLVIRTDIKGDAFFDAMGNVLRWDIDAEAHKYDLEYPFATQEVNILQQLVMYQNLIDNQMTRIQNVMSKQPDERLLILLL